MRSSEGTHTAWRDEWNGLRRDDPEWHEMRRRFASWHGERRMLGFTVPRAEELQGQASFEMANLRPETTRLRFIVFISQRGGLRHGVRAKVAPAPKVCADQIGGYALRPFRHEGRPPLSSPHQKRLEKWVDQNMKVLVEYWDGEIEYAEDAIEKLVRI